ncbi:hypothetical protein H0A36_09230 [Endozoicomonas sp. SM1973]|uniref:Uncharacterized protein n=1 Tax=Spartinivicinus marinus TaxID=2994442 RepID=A0A853IAB6_9GAMM|nr:hypothetical protein [Spartinivicinus marinus]MCX4028129.1 hypothetical protein [Spartinivicinus marinus]NYZ66195.1 hypothetical protein [Spartinivicinus marinus]
MKSVISHQLSTRQLDVLQQVGDILAPGYGQLPSFSETGCLHHIDEVLDFTSKQNIKELKNLLTCLSFLPSRCIPLFISSLNTLSHIPGFIGQQCRLGFWGVKGLIFSLYYSNLTDPYQNTSRVYDAINYHVSCQPITQSNVIIKNNQES